MNQEPQKNNLIPIIMWLSVGVFGLVTIFNSTVLFCIISYLFGQSGG